MNKYNKPTKEIIKQAHDLVKQGHDKKEIADKFNIYYRTFLNHYEKYYPNTTKFRKGAKYFDNTFFEKIDTEDKAYWLGFIFADGAVCKSNTLEITLALKDIEHLKKFKKAIKSEHNIRIKKLKTPNGKIYERCQFAITNKKITDDLRKYGLHNKKTYDCSIPFKLIPKRLFHHFVRGLFDGDGSVYKIGTQKESWKEERLSVTVLTTVSVQMANDIINSLFDYGNICCTYNIDRRDKYVKAKEAYNVMINRSREIQRFYNWLYKNATIYLERKYNIFAVSGQIAWRPETITTELSGEEAKAQPEPKATINSLDCSNAIDSSNASQGQSVEDDTFK